MALALLVGALVLVGAPVAVREGSPVMTRRAGDRLAVATSQPRAFTSARALPLQMLAKKKPRKAKQQKLEATGMAAQSGTARSAVARAVPTATNVSGGPTAPSPPPAALAGPSRPVAAVPVARATQVAPNQEKVPMAKPVPTPLNSSARISDLPVSPVIVELAATTSEKSAASSGIPTATVVPLDAIEAQTQPLGADVSSSQEATQATLLAPTSDDEDNDDLALELLELVDEISGRGADVTPQDLSDVLEIVGDLEISDWADTNWDRSPHLAGAWGLRFTNSKAFHLNGGITGYARDIKGVQTPELIMKVRHILVLGTLDKPVKNDYGPKVFGTGMASMALAMHVDDQFNLER
eukprot:scaffold22650_cov28-Tisochrysis_lutea.AAC.2